MLNLHELLRSLASKNGEASRNPVIIGDRGPHDRKEDANMDVEQVLLEMTKRDEATWTGKGNY